MNDVGKEGKMIDFLNVTPRALASLHMTYNKQGKKYQARGETANSQ